MASVCLRHYILSRQAKHALDGAGGLEHGGSCNIFDLAQLTSRPCVKRIFALHLMSAMMSSQPMQLMLLCLYVILPVGMVELYSCAVTCISTGSALVNFDTGPNSVPSPEFTPQKFLTQQYGILKKRPTLHQVCSTPSPMSIQTTGTG